MASPNEPTVDPQYLIRSLRSFLAVAQPPDTAADTSPAAEGWEEAGSLIWDTVASQDDAAFLLRELPELPQMLAAALLATAAAENWRALEIGLGILANLAVHDTIKHRLLEEKDLPELLLDRLLWVDDAAALSELCRCLAGLLTESDSQALQRWWSLLLREQTLGRTVWILENTLSTGLLERTLNLLSTMVAAAAAAVAAGDRGKEQLVPILLSLDLLPLLASVLAGWLARLHAEEQIFNGNGKASGKRKRRSASPEDWGAGEGQQVQDAAGSRGRQAEVAAEGDDDPPAEVVAAVAASPGPEAETPAELATASVVAAEVSEPAALEALGLVEALAALPAGDKALGGSETIQHALVRLIGESDQHSLQSLAAALLASLDGAGAQLLTHPGAVAAVLDRLAEHARPEADRELGTAAAAVAQRQAEEVEAGWALLSSLAHALGQLSAGEGAAEGQEGQEQREDAHHHKPHGAAVLAALLEQADLLCYDWTGSAVAAAAGNGGSLQRHQSYVLGRLGQRLAALPAATEQQRAALAAALQRIQPAAKHK